MGLTERLARASSRHPWRVLLGWLAAIVLALGLAVTLLPGNLTTNGHVTNNPESAQAERIFYRDFPPDRRGVDELIVVRSATRTVADPAFRRFAAGLVARAKATGVVHRAAALAVSRDRHAVLIGIQRQADVDPLLPVVEQSNGHIRFMVSDEGIGVPEAERERIFDKFIRLDPEMSRGIGGTGLGLYICRELVGQMGGRIWVSANQPRGSTFAFEIPAEEGGAEA